jgi:hypothetical protein
MEEISLQYEESFLRAPIRDDEVVCQTKLACAKGNLTCFVTPKGQKFSQCLLCIRKRVTDQWYEGTIIQQPWYVKTESPGEYHGDMLLPPSRTLLQPGPFIGITHPFPRYQSQNLVWDGTGRVKQTQVEFQYETRRHACLVDIRGEIFPDFSFLAFYAATLESDLPGEKFPLVNLLRRYVFLPLRSTVSLKNEYENTFSPLMKTWFNRILGDDRQKIEEEIMIIALREHIVLLIENDDSLREYFHRMGWNKYFHEIKLAAERYRNSGPIGQLMPPRISIPLTSRLRNLFRLRKYNPISTGGEKLIDRLLELKDEPDRIIRDVVDDSSKHVGTQLGWLKWYVNCEYFKAFKLPEGHPFLVLPERKQYYCEMCWKIQTGSAVLQSGNKQGGIARGSAVMYNWDTGKVTCYRARTNGRRRLLEEAKLQGEGEDSFELTRSTADCDGLCVSLPFGTHVVMLANETHLLCPTCHTQVSLTWNFLVHSQCEKCQEKQNWEDTCVFCHSRLPKCAFVEFQTFDYGIYDRLHPLRVCKKHTKRLTEDEKKQIWPRALLLFILRERN